MSQQQENRVSHLEQRIIALEKMVLEGYQPDSEGLERLKTLEAKYHMLNARLKKYYVDEINEKGGVNEMMSKIPSFRP